MGSAARVVRGRARVGRRTKNLIPHLQRGEIAIIDHCDLDSVCASGLIGRRVAAVVNASPSLSGRYPAAGTGMLLSAAIPLYDSAGSDLLQRVANGAVLEVRPDGTVACNGETLACARRVTEDVLEEGMAKARARVATEISAFVDNTLAYLAEEWPLLFDEQALPELDTPIHGRDVVIVVRGEGYREDLQAIRPYIRDVRPVLLAVDGGADALLEMGFTPHIVLGDMDSVSDAALRCGAELIVHGYRRQAGGGQPAGAASPSDAPGLPRIEALGLPAKVLHAVGTSEDVAMILSERKGARLIVAVGTHFSLQEFLDKGRKGMSSTFLARLKVGSILVDAKGVSQLYRRGLRLRDTFFWIILPPILVAYVVLMVSEQARNSLELLLVHLQVWLRRF